MKTKSLFFIFVVLLFFFLILSHPTGLKAADPKFGGTLRVAMSAEPPTIDGHWTTATIVFTISCHYLESLFTLDDKY